MGETDKAAVLKEAFGEDAEITIVEIEVSDALDLCCMSPEAEEAFWRDMAVAVENGTFEAVAVELPDENEPPAETRH